MKITFNRNQKRVTPWDIQLSCLTSLMRQRIFFVFALLNSNIVNSSPLSMCGSFRRAASEAATGSSDRQCPVKQGVLKNFANFTEKHLCWCLILIKLQIFRPVTLLKRLRHKFFPAKSTKLLRTPIWKNICERLLLKGLTYKF